MKKYRLFITLSVLMLSISVSYANTYSNQRGNENLDGIVYFEVHKTYYPNGTVWMEMPLKKGYLHGIAKTYYENGQLESESSYEDGKRHGLTKIYYENGQLQREARYRKGKEIGVTKTYQPEGPLLEEMVYLDDKMVGEQRIFHEDGHVWGEAKFSDPMDEGFIRVYDYATKRHLETTYRKGELYKIREYDQSGNLISEKTKKGKKKLSF